MTEMNMVEAINSALKNEMEKDDRVILLGEDVGVDGGVFRVTDGLLKKFGSERVIDTPLSESGIVGTSIGMALYGLRPIAEIQFMGFLHPAFDQLTSHASRYRNRTWGRYTVPLVVRMPYGGGVKVLEHHGESFEAILAHTPGLKVVIPSTPYDAKGLLISSIRDPDPVIFLEPKKLYRAFKQEISVKEYTIPLEKVNVVRKGDNLTMISYGAMMRPTLKAAELVAKKGINAEVIDLRTISPLDVEGIIKSVKKTGRVVIVHEGPKTCGVAAEIIARINEQALLNLEAPVERVTGFDVPFPFYKMEDFYLPNVDRIVKAMRKVLKF